MLAPTLTDLSGKPVASCREGTSLQLGSHLSPAPFSPLLAPSRGCQFNGQVFNSSLPGAWKCQHHCTSVCGVCSSKNSEKLNSAIYNSALSLFVSNLIGTNVVLPFPVMFSIGAAELRETGRGGGRASPNASDGDQLSQVLGVINYVPGMLFNY